MGFRFLYMNLGGGLHKWVVHSNSWRNLVCGRNGGLLMLSGKAFNFLSFFSVILNGLIIISHLLNNKYFCSMSQSGMGEGYCSMMWSQALECRGQPGGCSQMPALLEQLPDKVFCFFLLLLVFCYCKNYQRQSTYKGKRFTLAHDFGGFSPW